MVLQQKLDGLLALFTLLWSGLFAGGPLVIGAMMIYKAGVIDLSCQRIEPTQVSCELSQSHVFGPLSGKPIDIQKVTAAQVLSETQTSEDGDYPVYLTRLVGQQGYLNVGDFSTN